MRSAGGRTHRGGQGDKKIWIADVRIESARQSFNSFCSLAVFPLCDNPSSTLNDQVPICRWQRYGSGMGQEAIEVFGLLQSKLLDSYRGSIRRVRFDLHHQVKAKGHKMQAGQSQMQDTNYSNRMSLELEPAKN